MRGLMNAVPPRFRGQLVHGHNQFGRYYSECQWRSTETRYHTTGASRDTCGPQQVHIEYSTLRYIAPTGIVICNLWHNTPAPIESRSCERTFRKIDKLYTAKQLVHTGERFSYFPNDYTTLPSLVGSPSQQDDLDFAVDHSFRPASPRSRVSRTAARQFQKT